MSGRDRFSLPLAALIGALVVGTIGYFLGLAREAPPRGYSLRGPGSGPAGEEVRLAPSQAELAGVYLSPNRGRFQENLDRLAAERRGLTDEVGRPSDAEWDQAVAARTERRAYNGAPPVIPHDIEQQGFPSCLVCHRDGIVIDGRTAPAMSHEPISGCPQCHVVGERPMPGAALTGGPLEVPSGFSGVARAGRGERAWPGAPPTIPHTTWMRERCESCHGVLARGLRSSHACQQSCQQCHGPSAGLDQAPATAASAMPLASPPTEAGPPPLRPARP